MIQWVSNFILTLITSFYIHYAPVEVLLLLITIGMLTANTYLKHPATDAIAVLLFEATNFDGNLIVQEGE